LNIKIRILILIIKFQIVIIITDLSTEAWSTLIIICNILNFNLQIIFIGTFLLWISIISTLIRIRLSYLINLLELTLIIFSIWMVTWRFQCAYFAPALIFSLLILQIQRSFVNLIQFIFLNLFSDLLVKEIVFFIEIAFTYNCSYLTY